MQTTNISWAVYSWNPITGCSHAGPECWNCYAETVSNQQAQRDTPPAGATEKAWSVANASDVVQMHPDRLTDPDEYTWPKGSGTVFVGSMTDMFHSEVDPAFVQRVLDKCREYPEHLWIWLTKRPQNAADWRLDWPDNAMLGTSVGSGPGGRYPSTTHRIEQLRDVDVELKWVSAEPLIEPLGELVLDHVDWVVVGGESGSQSDRREMDHEWARDILRQCRDAGVPFYFKQSSGANAEQGTRITVRNDETGLLEQREIREFPALPETAVQAREQLTTEETETKA